jgi:entericidin B
MENIMTISKKVVSLLSLSALVLVITGCNTIEGAGQDIKKGGAAIEKAADEHK